MEAAQKTTISVPEMTRLLGLKKTEGYWLVHKKQFQTVMIAGQMRIVLSSFEEWYANQTHYKKVDGSAPGSEIKSISYSINDLSKLLNISDDCVYDLLKKEDIPIIIVSNQKRVKKRIFHKWLSQQSHYRTPQQREADSKAIKASISLPDMGRMICLNRNQTYQLVKSTPALEVIVIGDQKRVTIESFNTWYANQSDYRKFDELTKEDQEQFIAEHENESLGKVLRMKKEKESKEKFGKEWYSTDEAASILGISKSAVLRLIRSGQLGAEKVNHSLKILKQDIIWYLNPPQIKKEDEIHGVDSD